MIIFEFCKYKKSTKLIIYNLEKNEAHISFVFNEKIFLIVYSIKIINGHSDHIWEF